MSAAAAACVVLVTTPVAADAERIVHVLLEERLVACGSILPGLTSSYRWQGAVQREGEVLLLLKTTQARLPELTERIAALHPYEVPEVLALPVLGGLPAYLAWLESCTAGDPAGERAEKQQ